VYNDMNYYISISTTSRET